MEVGDSMSAGRFDLSNLKNSVWITTKPPIRSFLLSRIFFLFKTRNPNTYLISTCHGKFLPSSDQRLENEVRIIRRLHGFQLRHAFGSVALDDGLGVAGVREHSEFFKEGIKRRGSLLADNF